jgi:hypothetical protein
LFPWPRPPGRSNRTDAASLFEYRPETELLEPASPGVRARHPRPPRWDEFTGQAAADPAHSTGERSIPLCFAARRPPSGPPPPLPALSRPNGLPGAPNAIFVARQIERKTPATDPLGVLAARRAWRQNDSRGSPVALRRRLSAALLLAAVGRKNRFFEGPGSSDASSQRRLMIRREYSASPGSARGS